MITEKIKLFYKRTQLVIDTFFYKLFCFFTKLDEKIIVFEGTHGAFDESSWVLYNYLRKKNKYRFVWMVKNSHCYNCTNDTIFVSRSHRCIHFKAEYYYAKAKYTFYTHSTNAVKNIRSGQEVVFIGHGYAIKNKKKEEAPKTDFTYALAIGENAIEAQSKFLGCNKELFLPLGLPRNDLLLANNMPGAKNPFVYNKKFKKLIIWMPTFRKSYYDLLSEDNCDTETGLPIYETVQSLFELNEFLEGVGCLIILKIHMLQQEKDVYNNRFSNIIILKNSDLYKHDLQLYEVVGKTDALLTDYSSVSVDYLLLNKPIGYIISDIDCYNDGRGFTSEEPTDLMPGNLIRGQEDFISFVFDVLNGKDCYKEQRELLKNRLHAAKEGNSCELIESYFKL